MPLLTSSFERKLTGKSLWESNTVFFAHDDKKLIQALKKENILIPSSVANALENKKEAIFYTDAGLVSLNILAKTKGKDEQFTFSRDYTGPRLSQLIEGNPKQTNVHFLQLNDDTIRGILVGYELAAYRYELKSCLNLAHCIFLNDGKKLSQKVIDQATQEALGINTARHLVNMPPNELHPVNFASLMQKVFRTSKTIKVEVWDEKKLAKEKCGLHLGVGAGSAHPPRLVKLSYKGTGTKKKKVALVGKGITFDTGGLDIKPAAGMRLMKKDMGGAATIVGFFTWLETQKIPYDIDGYLALAENSIDERATRPSDIHVARNGLKVEIDNTDAEGRLVLADTLDIACDSKPDFIIDAATLTGAGKVALGQDIASLFCNDEKLAKDLIRAGIRAGDPCWRMPLYQPYMKELSSSFADCVNSSSSGFGGSITAALFLQKFVRDIPWAHLDIFAWTTSNQPSLVQKGGSGQSVGTLIEFFGG